MATKRSTKSKATEAPKAADVTNEARAEGWIAVEPIRKTNNTHPGKSVTMPGHPIPQIRKHEAERLAKLGAIRWGVLPTPAELEALDRPKVAERGVHALPLADIDLGPNPDDLPDEEVSVDEIRASLAKMDTNRLRRLAREKGIDPTGMTHGAIVDAMTGREPEGEEEVDVVAVLEKAGPLEALDFAAVYGLARKVGLEGRDDMTEDDLRVALSELAG